MKFIVKLFPEIMVKGGPVKKKMITMLTNNLQTLLSRIDGSIEVKKFWDKIEVQVDDQFIEPVRKALSQHRALNSILRWCNTKQERTWT